MALINSISQLREVVKINNSKSFDTYAPFVNDAQDKYLVPLFGAVLLDALEQMPNDELTLRLQRALGPLSLALAAPEMSISFGEAGHTVTRTDNQAPASDAKIEKAVQSLLERGFANLGQAISYLATNEQAYAEHIVDMPVPALYRTDLFKDAADFQLNGMVDIDYSPLTFIKLVPLIRRIEGVEVPRLLGSAMPQGGFVGLVDAYLKLLLSGYVASRVAALHTSATSRTQRSRPRTLVDFEAFIRPLFENPEDDLNFYNSQAQQFAQDIHAHLIDSGAIDAQSLNIKWNDEDKKIFIAGAL